MTTEHTRSSNQPRTRGNWRLRLLRHHAPLALASALVLILFMALPAFDVSAYPPGDIRTGTFPQPMDMDMGHGGAAAGRAGMDHGGGGRAGSPNGEHGAGGAGSMGDAEMQGMMHASYLGFSVEQWTVGTGYVALGLLGLTLLIGPANVLLRRRNPVSSYLRRDVGTRTAIASVVHVIFGFEVHGSLTIGGILGYFVRDGAPLTSSFGLGNWTGLAATLIVVGLLALSSDFALRKLKAGTWKDLQRLNYTLFALVIAHAFFYGALLRMESPFTLLLIVAVITVFVGQAIGVWLWRRRYARSTATAA